MLNMYIILDKAVNVTDTQYCFIRSKLTWDDGKVFLLTHVLYLSSGALLNLFLDFVQQTLFTNK